MKAYVLRLARRSLLALTFALVLSLPPMLPAAASIAARLRPAPEPPAFGEQMPAPPVHDAGRLTAVVLAGNRGAESFDLLAPYEVLAATGAFNMYTVAPERRLTPLFPGSPILQGVDLLPHYSFAEYDRLIGAAPDVIVAPFIPSVNTLEDAPVLAWMRERLSEDSILLTICGGAWTAADAGLLVGREATIHQNVFPVVEQRHPEVEWVRGRRWVEDGPVVSSAGLTAGFDATLHVVERLVGRDAAVATAHRLNYRHLGFLDDPTFAVPAPKMAAPLLNWAYRWESTDIGLALYDGVGEIELGSIADVYPRSFAATVHTIAPERSVIRSRHGLDLVPRHDLRSAPSLDRVIVPGAGPDSGSAATIEAWARDRQVAVEYLHRDAPGTFPMDVALRDMARHDTRAVTAAAAIGLEYPIADSTLEGAAWPIDLLARPVALGLLGVGLALALGRQVGARRTAAA